jgi:hypothetical protein
MVHQPHSMSSKTPAKDSLAFSREPDAVSAARARAFIRLHENRVMERRSPSAQAPVSRRDILSCALHGVGLATSWSFLAQSVRAERGPVTPEETSQKNASRSFLAQPHRFAWESVLFQSGQYALAAICNHLKLPVGNATLKAADISKNTVISVVERFEKDPLLPMRLYGSVAWLAPLSEETLFRLVPQVLLRRDGMMWEVGIPFNLAFAGIHNIVDIRQETKRAIELSEAVKLSLDTFPLSQFMLGAFCWYVMRRYGELAPILAHSLNNQVPALALIWGGRGTLVEFNELLAEELAREDSEISAAVTLSPQGEDTDSTERVPPTS